MSSSSAAHPTATVIIPAARDGFGPSGKPCWLREHPAGHLVIHHLLSALDLTLVSRVIIATTSAHVDKWLSGDTAPLLHHLRHQHVVPNSTELCILALDRETTSAADTVACAIRQCRVEGSIFVKDQDGRFTHKVVPNADYVVGYRLTETGAGREAAGCGMPFDGDGEEDAVDNLPSKSFLLTTGALLSNIVEKRVVSDTICSGGYAFRTALDFLDAVSAVEKIQDRVTRSCPPNPPTATTGATTASLSATQSPPSVGPRLFLSHIVQYQMLHLHKVFSVDWSPHFSDWKTEPAWRRFVQRFKNVDIAIEGVLFVSSRPNDVVGNLIGTHWAPVPENIEYLKKMPRRDRTHITLRSKQPAEDEAKVRALLSEAGVPYDVLVLNTFSSTSYLVSAYSGAGGDLPPHPSSVAYSIPENSRQQLASVLHFSSQ